MGDVSGRRRRRGRRGASNVASLHAYRALPAQLDALTANSKEDRSGHDHGGEPIDSSGKLRFIEGMRGAAALYVALGHLCSMVDPAKMVGLNDASPELMKRFVSCFAYGHLAVAIFIVISGFSLQLSLFTSGDGTLKRVGRFYSRRARRILPTYYACLASSLAVAWFITPQLVTRYHAPFSMYLPVSAATFWSHLFLIHNWSPAWMYKINGVLWSIGIEVQLYVVFPLLVRGINRFGRVLILGLSALAALVVLNYVAEAPKLYPWYVPLFVSGMVGANLAYRPHLRIGLLPGLALALSSVLVAAGVWSCSQGTNLPVQDALFGLAAASGMYAMAVKPMLWVARGFRLRWLTFVGGFSYTLYLMHHPIEQVMYWLKPISTAGPEAVAYQFLVTLPVVILGTWLFSLVFEKPFMPKSSRAKAVAALGSEPEDGLPSLQERELVPGSGAVVI
jgi:peptidoglycan/LPS O-acetylase OafA/YrhL